MSEKILRDRFIDLFKKEKEKFPNLTAIYVKFDGGNDSGWFPETMTNDPDIDLSEWHYTSGVRSLLNECLDGVVGGNWTVRGYICGLIVVTEENLIVRFKSYAEDKKNLSVKEIKE